MLANSRRLGASIALIKNIGSCEEIILKVAGDKMVLRGLGKKGERVSSIMDIQEPIACNIRIPVEELKIAGNLKEETEILFEDETIKFSNKKSNCSCHFIQNEEQKIEKEESLIAELKAGTDYSCFKTIANFVDIKTSYKYIDKVKIQCNTNGLYLFGTDSYAYGLKKIEGEVEVHNDTSLLIEKDISILIEKVMKKIKSDIKMFNVSQGEKMFVALRSKEVELLIPIFKEEQFPNIGLFVKDAKVVMEAETLNAQGLLEKLSKAKTSVKEVLPLKIVFSPNTIDIRYVTADETCKEHLESDTRSNGEIIIPLVGVKLISQLMKDRLKITVYEKGQVRISSPDTVLLTSSIA